ncbi:MAG: hypothetical protein HC882_09335 [Acidobacteria bacterium]|nr:hypothetical protein [Acidobacteriota bacterium]
MDEVGDILAQYGKRGVETTFKVAGRTYHVFAFPSPGKEGTQVRWNLYAIDEESGRPSCGLSFGMARGVREAMEEVVEAAREHAKGATPPRPARTFRPSPSD